MNETKYLYFSLDLEASTVKTEVWEIFSKSSALHLGTIKWFGRWRQYCFFPEPETVFNMECMSDISRKIKGLMEERKQK